MIKRCTEGRREFGPDTEMQGRGETAVERESRDLAVISCFCLEINHRSLHGPVLFQSRCAFTSV